MKQSSETSFIEIFKYLYGAFITVSFDLSIHVISISDKVLVFFINRVAKPSRLWFVS